MCGHLCCVRVRWAGRHAAWRGYLTARSTSHVVGMGGPWFAGGMAHLLFVRHGQSEWNAAGRWQGWADPPLSELGETQAAQAAERLTGLDLAGAVSSDLLR